MKQLFSLISLLVLFTISACGGGGGSSISMSDQPDPDPTPNTSIPSCSTYSSIENTLYCFFDIGGMTREFYIYIPNAYSEYITPVSIIFSLHGGGDYAEYNMQYSGFKEHADTDTIILIYPQGAIYEDKGATGWNHEEGGVDDIAFIESIIDWAGANYNVQLNEVYAAGFSNGAFMTYHLACNLSAKIAAIAPVAGLMGNYTYDTCNPIHPTPLVHIHGEQDDIININGGEYFRPLEDNNNSTGVISYWKDYNQCSNFLNETVYDDDQQIIGFFNSWTSCSNNIEINYWILPNRGHEWDEGDKGEANSFDTSQVIWNFFKQYDMNGLKN